MLTQHVNQSFELDRWLSLQLEVISCNRTHTPSRLGDKGERCHASKRHLHTQKRRLRERPRMVHISVHQNLYLLMTMLRRHAHEKQPPLHQFPHESQRKTCISRRDIESILFSEAISLKFDKITRSHQNHHIGRIGRFASHCRRFRVRGVRGF